jgi:hypothetical protein
LVECGGGPAAHRDGFGGASIQRVAGVAGPFILIVRLEPAAGEGEQLGLQVGGEQLHGLIVRGGDGDRHRAPAHLLQGGAAVIGGDRRQGRREVDHVGRGGDLRLC